MPLLDMKSVRSGNQQLVGPFRTRDEARRAYTGIVVELNDIEDRDTLDIYVLSITDVITQYQRAMPFLWDGDDSDFIGLKLEIEATYQRISEQDFGVSPNDVPCVLSRRMSEEE